MYCTVSYGCRLVCTKNSTFTCSQWSAEENRNQACQITAPGFTLLLQYKTNEVQQHHKHHTRCSIICAAVWTWPKLRTLALRSDLWLPERWGRTFATSDGTWNTNEEKNLNKWSESTVSQLRGRERGHFPLLQPDSDTRQLFCKNFVQCYIYYFKIPTCVCSPTGKTSTVLQSLCMHIPLGFKSEQRINQINPHTKHLSTTTLIIQFNGFSQFSSKDVKHSLVPASQMRESTLIRSNWILFRCGQLVGQNKQMKCVIWAL